MPAVHRHPAHALAVLLLLAAPGALQPGCSRAPRPRPPVCLLILDTLRADFLGIQAPERPAARFVSPELDALAHAGVRFNRAYAQASWTRPSTGSFLTGIHPRSLGLHREARNALPQTATTLAEMLRGAGYRTLGLTANPTLNRAFGFAQGFDAYVDSHVVWKEMAAPGDAVYEQNPLASAQEIFDAAIALLDAAPGADAAGPAAPVYLQLNLMDVHEYHRDITIRPEFQVVPRSAPEPNYWRAVRQLSHDVGRFVARLRSRPGFEDTLFVLVSDHGEGLRDHPSVPDAESHGHTLYESQLHVPWILYQAGGALPAGTVVTQQVRMLDLVPTLLDHLGIEAPSGLQGRSLMPLVRDPRKGRVALPQQLFFDVQFRDKDNASVYAPGWKYFRHRVPQPGTDPEELYPRNGVPENGSANNQLARHPRIGARLAAELDRWLEATPAPADTTPGAMPSATEIEQLRAIGYGD